MTIHPEVLEAAIEKWIQASTNGLRVLRSMGGLGLKEMLVRLEERVIALDQAEEKARASKPQAAVTRLPRRLRITPPLPGVGSDDKGDEPA